MKNHTVVEPVLDMLRQESVQSVVHDLRGPMTVIKGNLLILLSGMMGSMPEEQLMLLKRSVGPLEDLILMTENLLQAAKLEDNDLGIQQAPTDLDRLMAETIDFYQIPFKQRDMQIYREGNTLGVRMMADASWLKRVLHNLIWNAFKFTPDHGRVTLHVHRTTEGLEIEVKDTGRGIPTERLDAIFEKFVQAQPRRDRHTGTGIGLWICKRVMELHGGTIRAESDEKGSRFILFFPADNLLP